MNEAAARTPPADKKSGPHFFGLNPALRIGDLPIVQYEPGVWERVFRTDRPCVVRGFVSSWPAFESWNLASLAAKAGEQKVWATLLGPGGVTPLDYPKVGPSADVTLAEVIKQVEEMAQRSTDGEAGQYYLAQGGSIFVLGKKTGNLAILAEDIRTVHPRASANLWLGAGGQRSSLHYDYVPGVMHVLHGTKHWLMIPPSETAKVKPTIFPDYQGSKLPVFDEHAEQTDCKHWTVTLERGDSLFIPAGTWHAVRNVGMNFAVNNWWDGKQGVAFKPSLRIWAKHMAKRWVWKKVNKMLWPSTP